MLKHIILAALMLALGWYTHGWYHKHSSGINRTVRLGNYRFISPLLDVELPEGYDARREPIPFKNTIKKYIDSQIKEGKIKNASVYFRDLSDGPWFGINEQINYNAASLLKVPIMIAWLKRAEQNPTELERTYTFREDLFPGWQQSIKPARTLSDGVAYTVETLLGYMLNESDNRAMWLLYENLKPQELDDVLDSMDIINSTESGENTITVHGYSGFFRILYNASYLNRQMSDKALRIMSHQNFPNGIELGLPKGTVFSGKFGEHVTSNSETFIQQVHEFGIVYHPKGPYIIGIMTTGSNISAQLAVLQQVSAITYAEFSKSRPSK